MVPRVLSIRWWLPAVILTGTILSLTSPQADAQPPRAQQIADLEKQLADLNKKLDELKKAPAAAAPADSAKAATLPADWAKALTWRSIGPASMGGRIVALAVNPNDPAMYWAATASGGLLKTVNGGITYEHQFDKEATVSIGDVAVSASNPDIVWVGTGENNPRNSVSYGDGVYKSTDGGKKWTNMGLKGTFQIGKIAVHPKNPDVVYVGALGRLYGPSDERGLFKTEDGGKTWKKIHFVDNNTGVIDLQIDPSNPDNLLIATWERKRDEFDSWPGAEKMEDGYDGYDPIRKWGAGSGLYKTTDGGKTFTKLTKGLPTCHLGRIGIDYYKKDPKVVYAIIDSAKIGMGTPPKQGYLGLNGEDVEAGGGAKITDVTADGPAAKAGVKVGDVVVAVGEQPVRSFNRMAQVVQGKKGGDKVELTLLRGGKEEKVTATLGSKEPERIVTRPYGAFYGGQVANAQDIQGPDGHELGGVYRSDDGGESWKRVNSLNPRPMYFSCIRVDPSDDKYVYVCGVNFHKSSDGGKKFTDDAGKTVHPDQHTLWIDPRDGRHMLVGCDGGLYLTRDRTEKWDFLSHVAIGQFYHVCVDASKPYRVFGGLQDNGTWGGPSRTLRGSGATNDDWLFVGGGDGFMCRSDPTDPDLVYYTSQDGAMVRRNLRTGEQGFLRPANQKGQPVYRFNWNTPFILSAHNPSIFYSAGNHVFRSVQKGSNQRVFSPEITRTPRGSGTALAESPKNADVLWAGTDDGYLWVTKDGGKEWKNVTDKVGLPGPRWVSTIEASRFAEGRAYVTFDGHRSNDDSPYVYMTDDYGQTWKAITNNLPWGSTRVCREDIENPDVLYVGTEFAAYASVDRGASWTKINNNLPTVAIHEFAQHPTCGEMVAATHGRSLWVLDATPLRQMSTKTVAAKETLYKPATVVRWRSEPRKGTIYGVGDRGYVGTNPPSGAQVYVSLTAKPEKASVKVVDFQGQTVATLAVPKEVGLHKVEWNLTQQQGVAGVIGSIFGGGRRPGGGQRSIVPVGDYRLVLTVDGREQSQPLKIEADPLGLVPPLFAFPGGEREEGEEEMGK